MVKGLDCNSGTHWFDSSRVLHFASVAQLVERLVLIKGGDNMGMYSFLKGLYSANLESARMSDLRNRLAADRKRYGR